ncbi:hypothetical protein [uncultured Tolumonas sp.]|uniref:hypothetical protein n=1 Tax=uncultured Tolumonas sp. TaxID=263765 RepID=UPI002A0A39B5|nr:hypothetical protein [uncultured Tolumonas sp.]
MKTTFNINNGYVCVIFKKLPNGMFDAKHALVIDGVQITNYSGVSSQGFASKDEVVDFIRKNYYENKQP